MRVWAHQIYVEVERARLVRSLAKIKEEQGKIGEAAEIMQEVAVETHGGMAKTEKIAFILEQVRLCLDKEDYIRASILAKKITPRAFFSDEKKKDKDDKKGKKPEGKGDKDEDMKDATELSEEEKKKEEKKKANKAGLENSEGFLVQDAAAGTPSLPELKIMYYLLMIRYHSHHNSYLEICRCYQSIFEDQQSGDIATWGPVLQKICW